LNLGFLWCLATRRFWCLRDRVPLFFLFQRKKQTMSDGTGADWGFWKLMRDLTCGSLAGIAQAYSGQPLDTVKVRIQTNPALYRGAIDCLAKTLRTEPPLALFSGVVPMASACLLENAVLLAGYGQCQALVRKVSGVNERGELSNMQLAAAGSLSGVLAGLVLSPTELIKCRLQVQGLAMAGGHHASFNVQGLHGAPKLGPLGATIHLVKTEGIRGIYRGLSYTWLRDVPTYGVNFYAYEGVRRLLTKPGERVQDLSTGRLIIAGGTAGAASWAISYPLDVLKSRVQVSEGEIPNVFACIRHTLQTEGPAVFFRGITPCIIRGFIAFAALFVTYEWTAKQFDRLSGRFPRKDERE